MLFINFRDERLIAVLDKMISGLLPYNAEQEKQIKEELESFIKDKISINKIEANLERRHELEEELITALENKKVEINERLSYYTKFIDLDILSNDKEAEIKRLYDIVVKQKLDLSDKLFDRIVKYIKVDEFPVEYYVIMNILEKIAEIDRANRLDGIASKTILTQERFEEILENNIEEIVVTRAKEIQLTSYMEKDGLNTNFNLETTIDDAMSYLYNRCINKYNKIIEEGKSVAEAISMEYELKSTIKTVMAYSALEAGSYILNDKLYVGKRVLRGSSDYFYYMKYVAEMIEMRLEGKEAGEALRLSDLSKVEEETKKFKPVELAKWRIAPLDDSYSIMSHSLITLTAMEGTGKTNTACNVAASCMIDGLRVLYVSTESTKPKILAQIQSSYIFQKYGKRIPYKSILEKEKLPENIQKLIKMVTIELGLNDSLIIEQYIKYSEFETKMIRYREDDKVDIVILDHCGMLVRDDDKNLTLREYLTDLSEGMVRIKNSYGMTFIVLSHPSVDAKADIKKYGEVQEGTSPTRDCPALSRDCDLSLFLTKNEEDNKKEFINMQVVKTRGNPLSNPMLTIRTDFDVSSIGYDPKDQVSFAADNDEAQDIIDEITRNLN